jgi:hypothetical protein
MLPVAICSGDSVENEYKQALSSPGALIQYRQIETVLHPAVDKLAVCEVSKNWRI